MTSAGRCCLACARASCPSAAPQTLRLPVPIGSPGVHDDHRLLPELVPELVLLLAAIDAGLLSCRSSESLHIVEEGSILSYEVFREMDGAAKGQPHDQACSTPLLACHSDRPTVLVNNVQAVCQADPGSQDASSNIGRPAKLVENVWKISCGYPQS
jgi:hypothetical protein